MDGGRWTEPAAAGNCFERWGRHAGTGSEHGEGTGRPVRRSRWRRGGQSAVGGGRSGSELCL